MKSTIEEKFCTKWCELFWMHEQQFIPGERKMNMLSVYPPPVPGTLPSVCFMGFVLRPTKCYRNVVGLPTCVCKWIILEN